MSYNVTVSGKDYSGVSQVKLPIKYGDGAYAVFVADADVEMGKVLDGSIENLSNDKVTELCGYALASHNKLKSVSLPNVVTVNGFAFDSCFALTDVNLPKAKDTWYNNIFYKCTSLVNIELPNTSDIGQKMFCDCTALKKVDIGRTTPNTKGSIAVMALTVASALEALIIRCPFVVTLANVNAFDSSGIKAGTGYIYVPSTLVDSYKAATNWSTFANQIRAIEDYPDICG